MTRRHSWVLVPLFCATAALPFLRSAGAAQADERACHSSAMAEPEPARRAASLRRCVDQFRSAPSALALASTLLKLRQPADAERACWQAVQFAGNNEMRARGFECAAQCADALGEPSRVIQFLRLAQKTYPLPGAEAELRARMSQTFRDAAAIAKDLAPTANDALPGRGAGLEYLATDLYINFEYDAAVITADGRRQVAALAEAIGLASAGAAGRFRIAGHTDVRGTDEYNLALSLRRATAVRDYLVTNFGVSRSALEVEGRGKREPLFSGTTEDDHARNRRVEVTRIDRP